ncbi:hypothetical protein E3U55_11295 [Filobacillus milosensis]|uniref:DUF3221 domain-containing protein n=1 Tax=Filobacillus milosensis TaxID=94137 RepID=A0A4Y8II39_9BACI|nr:hypothetical protein [Filobacillus milosensis]TFB19289.1 hypothetical protein E3U55_11295 [Filobacillus milosensis]
MKKSIILLIIILFISACSDNNELEGDIVFGKLKGNNEIQAINVFTIGEKMNFLIETNQKIGVEEVNVTLNILNPKGDYEEVTSNSMPTNPEADQIMNGLPASLFEQLGAGAYQLEVNIDGTVVKGEFIYEE